jgi:hypothetical protein
MAAVTAMSIRITKDGIGQTPRRRNYDSMFPGHLLTRPLANRNRGKTAGYLKAHV